MKSLIALAITTVGLRTAYAALPSEWLPNPAALPAHSTQAPPTTETGIPLDAPWKVQEYEYARMNANHPSWGLPHFERDYRSALDLARRDGVAVDTDALFAAAFLHDLGGLAPFEAAGVDHGVRSAELAEPLLLSWGFPMEKFALVKEIIVGHVYYGPAPKSPEALAFRDADILDFLGDIGVARILAVTEEKGFTPTLGGALSILRSFAKTLPGKLHSSSAKADAEKRVQEMERLFRSLDGYGFDGKAL